MKTKILLSLLVISLPVLSQAQQLVQYFDGADTAASNSLLIDIDTSASNIWQIGPPQKTVFDSAATVPNVIVTDTVNTYPVNNTSSFQYTIKPFTNWGVVAIQWKQKLDMDSAMDGGMIEFSKDTGNTWVNAFKSPFVYNFYGFDTTNVDTLSNGQSVFTGTDSTWKDIWICFDLSWLSTNDSLLVRHTFVSDSVDNNKDGWMMDNFMSRITMAHTINEKKQETYMTIGPNPTKGRINIATKKQNSFHIIENIALVNLEGKIVQRWENCPTKFYLDIGSHPNGIYFLKVKTNVKSETFKILLEQ